MIAVLRSELVKEFLFKMPQEHHILRCFACETFQVHIVKKVKKWECKLCGAKQSVKRNYGKGSGKDCRDHVMKLNELRGLRDDTSREATEEAFEEVQTDEKRDQQPIQNNSFTSKWTEYLSECDTDEESETEKDNSNFEMENVQKRQVRRKGNNKRRKTCGELTEGPQKVDPKITNFFFCDDFETGELNEKPSDNSKTASKPNHSKYSKYLDEEEPTQTLDGPTNKSSNIFESDPTDLDNILNF